MESKATKHCYKCGWEWELSGQPGRSDTCLQCRSDLRVCLNCISHNPGYAHECKDRRADPVAEKASANYCEYFDLARRPFEATPTQNTREDEAREKLRKLLE